ncbi:hypothetical protein I5907_07145 [Panacibacter sp. DH6]|uniref:Uncharacterized protein n=1 Tax=Panacibacter microcysteis TaxID=2793269 RepID=A0A931GXL1_9BACT|nr:hypothetical protein [Panacibacter microcysteis]MBG9376004.1 hypothetical protein [Panacibacter microcysteis]
MKKHLVTALLTAVGTGVGIAAYILIRQRKSNADDDTPSMAAPAGHTKLPHMFAYARERNGHTNDGR